MAIEAVPRFPPMDHLDSTSTGPATHPGGERHAGAGLAPRQAFSPHDAGASMVRAYLVEDSPVIRENLIATLEEMAHVVVVGAADTEGAATAWLQSSDNDCQLVIVDIFLKGGSGLGVLKSLSDRRRQRKVVVLSNYATPDMRRRCLELGADKVFDKSGDIDALIAYCEEIASGGA
jgi:DNA-binding NarL/FixJ family response regulator